MAKKGDSLTPETLKREVLLVRPPEACMPGVRGLAFQSYLSFVVDQASSFKVGNARFWLGENPLKMGYSEVHGGLT